MSSHLQIPITYDTTWKDQHPAHIISMCDCEDTTHIHTQYSPANFKHMQIIFLLIETYLIFFLDKIKSKKRTFIDDSQRSVLKHSFANNAYVTKETSKNLSQQLGLSEKTVSYWFVNRRRLLKKGLLKQPSSKRIYIYVSRVH